MKKKSKKFVAIINIIILLLIVYAGITGTDSNQKNILQEIIPTAGELATSTNGGVNEVTDVQDVFSVIRVVDGDTVVIRINGVDERVRLIGIDTPESVHPDEAKNVPYGKIAAEFTEKMLEGKTVGIELDVQERDQYGRLLAYVYLDGVMFNKTLLQEGHAVVATYPPNVKYVEDFTRLQENAREEGRGLWAL